MFCFVRFKARFFLFVDLQEFFSDLGSGDEKKSSENDQITGHFQSFFYGAFFIIFFLISPEKKTVKLVG